MTVGGEGNRGRFVQHADTYAEAKDVRRLAAAELKRMGLAKWWGARIVPRGSGGWGVWVRRREDRPDP